VDTVRAEHLSGSSDETIYETCRQTARTLITLDLDFASPFRFPPEGTEGIVVIRPPRPVLPAIRATLLSVLAELTSRRLTGMLWIPRTVLQLLVGNQTRHFGCHTHLKQGCGQ
jgi:hypothetical protein